jgi:hypothetical protein
MIITLDMQINCLKHEIERQKKALAKLVEAGKVSQADAISKIEILSAAFSTLTQLKGILCLQ